jgi:cell wall-associated NlpC family hydrolase
MSKLVDMVLPKLGCGYVWGSQGEILTQATLRTFKIRFGAKHYDLPGGISASKWLGKQVFDCSGLIVWALQRLGVFHSSADASAADLYYSWCNSVDKASLRPGDLVFRKTGNDIVHVGVYYKDGSVIEAKSTNAGVVIGDVDSFNMHGRLRLISEPALNPLVQKLVDKKVIKDPAYWETNLVSGKAVKADYLLIVFKAILGVSASSDIVRVLVDRRAIKDPAYWTNNLQPGRMLKSEYVIIVLKALLG